MLLLDDASRRAFCGITSSRSRSEEKTKVCAPIIADGHPTLTRPGSTLANRYLLEEALGRGASGSVFRAKDTALGIPVVIKVLHEGLAQAHDVLERFKRELILARRVTHPGLCKVFDMQSEGDTHFLVMEFIPGETLTNLLKREGKLTPARALDIMRQAASAMGTAHREGIVHRDLKPENIMMRPDGRIAVLDFGIATQEGLDRLTRPGFVLGSRKYMAPELWTGRPPTPQSDVWSLGIILFGALCGRLPYRADGPFGVLDAIKTEQRPAPSSLNPLVRPSLEAVIDRALAVEPGDRYPDAAALERALADELLALSEPTDVTVAPPELQALAASRPTLPAALAGPLVPNAIDLGAAPASPGRDVVVAPDAGEDTLGVDDDDEGPGRSHTNVDRGNASWESWAPDAQSVPSASGDASLGVSASAIGAAFDAVVVAPEPVSQDTKITPADAWRKADAALGIAAASAGADAGVERTLISKQPLFDSAAPSFFGDADNTLEGDSTVDLTEDLGRARVRRDDAPTMFVRTAPEDPLLVGAPNSSKKKLAALVGVSVVIVVLVMVVAIVGGGEREGAESPTPDIVATTKPIVDEHPLEVPPTTDVEPAVDTPSKDPPAKDPATPTETPEPVTPPSTATKTPDADSLGPENGLVKDPPVEAAPVENPPTGTPPVEGADDTAPPDTANDPVAAGDDTWEFDDGPETAPPEKAPPDRGKATSQVSAEDTRERARLKKVAETVAKSMRAKGLLRGDVRALDAELAKARSAVKSKKWASADASFERARAIIDSTTVDAALVAQKLARFNGRYDKVKDEARRAELGKLAIEIGKAMARSDHTTANEKLNQALSIAR